METMSLNEGEKLMTKYVEEKRYRGKVQAVILDWSGTTADAYVVAPATVFVEVFKLQNV